MRTAAGATVHRTPRPLRWSPLVRVTGRSMLPTLRPGQILVTRPVVGRQQVGDVVVIAAPDGGRLVKRLAAGPGDVVRMGAGRLVVNGPAPDGAYVATWRVPADHWFVVGDNLEESDDSRVWSRPYVPTGTILGVVIGTGAGVSPAPVLARYSRRRSIQPRPAGGRRLNEDAAAE